MHSRAIAELTRAKDGLQINLSRVEHSYSEILERYTVLSGTADSLRSQTVQLKAERDVLKVCPLFRAPCSRHSHLDMCAGCRVAARSRKQEPRQGADAAHGSDAESAEDAERP